ncbi:YD repeat protein [Pseudomonas putida]|nr:YD repeat protein [Pseudomonas putida]
MKKHHFYQGNKLSRFGPSNQMSVILQSSFAPLAEQWAGVAASAVLISTDTANSVVHAAGTTVYTPYGHFDLIRHGCALGFNGQARDPVINSDLLGNGKRAFSPLRMRFNSPDDLSPFGLGGVNAYAYCGGDPINYTDPTGNIKYNIALKRLTRNRTRILEPRDPALPTAVVRPRIGGELVDGPAAAPPAPARVQRQADPPAPARVHRQAAPQLPMSGPFTAEERENVAVTMRTAQTYPFISSQLLPGSRLVPTLVGHLQRQARGGSPPYPIEIAYINYIPNHNTPSGQQAASQALALARLVVAVSQTRSSS